MLKKLVEYTPEYLTSQPADMFVYLDSSGTADRIFFFFLIQDDGTITAQTPITDIANKLNVVENENYNEEFDKRWKLTEDSKTSTTIIPQDQMFDFIEAYPKIFTGFEIIIEFERNSNENILGNKDRINTDGNKECKVMCEDFSLMLAHIQLKNSARKLYEEYVYLMNL